MAPIRRYLRITKYSVLEVRIYLDSPQLAESWLLSPRLNVLPRVVEAVRPLVLPKLREENERVKAKGRKKGVRDVVVEDDFEVSVFLTETSTRHAILTKQKHFKEPKNKGKATTFDELTGNTNESAIDVDDVPPTTLREDSDEDIGLQDIPSAAPPETSPDSEEEPEEEEAAFATMRPSKRGRPSHDPDDSLFVSPSPDHPPSKRAKAADAATNDDKKKMGMRTTYDGFAIYGRVLCLVVKRREGARGKGPTAVGVGKAMMEEWIASTQAREEEGG